MNVEIKRITLIAANSAVVPATIDLGTDWDRLDVTVCGDVSVGKKDGTGFRMQLNGLYAMVVER